MMALTAPARMMARSGLRRKQWRWSLPAGLPSRSARYAYHLSDAGRSLDPVLRACLAWAEANIPDTASILATLEQRD